MDFLFLSDGIWPVSVHPIMCQDADSILHRWNLSLQSAILLECWRPMPRKECFELCFFEPCQLRRTELPQRLPAVTGSCVHVITVITLSSNALESLRYAQIPQKLRGFNELHCLKVQCRLRDFKCFKPIRSLGTKMAMMEQDMAPCVHCQLSGSSAICPIGSRTVAGSLRKAGHGTLRVLPVGLRGS